MKIEQYCDTAYEKELAARFRARMPEKVFDAHFHLSAGVIEGVAEQDYFEVYRKRTEEYLGAGKLQGGYLMATPANYKTQKEFDDDRQFSIDMAVEHPEFTIGLLATPWDTAEQMVKWIEQYPCIVGLKPYWVYAQVPDKFEADILDYAPEWMWELAEDRRLVMTLHLSHYGDMLKDRRNGEQLQYLRAKYPNVPIVLAHCAMGHHPDKLKSGLPYVEGMDNLWMDCSGVSEALSIIYCLQTLGSDRLLYGSDGYSFGYKPGSVKAIGSNFLGIHEPLELPPDYRYCPITNVCEGLLALFAAGDICGLTERQWQDVFYNNAASLFYKQ